MEAALTSHNAAAVKKLLNKDKKRGLLIHQAYALAREGTALHVACANGDVEIIDVLLKFKADINVKNNLQETPLHIACAGGNPDVITTLLEYNPDVTQTTEKGDTALHLLVQQKHAHSNIIKYHTIFRTLQQNGANLVERNEEGNTPLHSACLNKVDKNAMWLLKEGIDINISNKRGETPLHIVARLGPKELASVLIVGGASLSRQGPHGTPRETALYANQEEIVEIMDKLTNQTTSVSKSLVINGQELDLDMLHSIISRMKTLTKQTNEAAKSGDVESILQAREIAGNLKKYQLMIDILEINCIPLEDKNKSRENLFNGNLLFKEEDANDVDFNTWSQQLCIMEDNVIMLYSGVGSSVNSRRIPMDGNLSFQLFYGDTMNLRRFTMLTYEDGKTKEEHYAVDNNTERLACLKGWVYASGKPIEYIGDEQLMSLVEIALREDEGLQPKDLRNVSNRLRKKKAARSSSTPSLNTNDIYKKQYKRRRSISKNNKGNKGILSRGTSRKDKDIRKVMEITVVNGTIRTTNFQACLFSSLFSPSLKMDGDKDCTAMYAYYMSSGTISDLMQFILIHSSPELFGGNNDSRAFYLSYYKYASPEEILTLLEGVWEEHKDFPLSEPFKEYSSTSRLYHFIFQFVASPFVLKDSSAEIQFRSDLVSFYAQHMTEPDNEEFSIQNLRKLFDDVKKAEEKSRISSACNLNTLLTDKDAETVSELDVLSLSTEAVAAQIAFICADLFSQVKITELLDLRYQKDKEYAVGVTQVHDFSNRIYYIVPSTILGLDGEEQQLACLKAWIAIAEKLFQYRDYNSCIQILNGVTESSVIRLKHLKEGLSVKWIERLMKLKNTFDPELSFKSYRQLCMEAPTIPFIGVTLKDLTFAYDGNPDMLDDGINFFKMRITSDILHSLHIGSPKYYDYSFLPFDPVIAQSILQYVPKTQDELYDRSKFISNAKNAASEFCEDIPLLRKEIKNLNEENAQLKEALAKAQAELKKRDARIESLKENLRNATKGSAIPKELNLVPQLIRMPSKSF